MLMCIRSPGYIVSLPSCIDGIMRVDPEQLWEDKDCDEKPVIRNIIDAMAAKMFTIEGNSVDQAGNSKAKTEKAKSDKTETERKETETKNRIDMNEIIETSESVMRKFDIWDAPNDELILRKLKELKKKLEELKNAP